MDKTEIFNQHRRLLFSIAYGILGSVMDAEDIVQEAYLRWIDTTGVEAPKAYLSAIVTNLSINHLQSAKIQREAYLGPWLPEPLVAQTDDPQHVVELAESLSIAFLVMLEQCTPQERAALLLRQVFNYPYHEIAQILGIAEATCRQLVSRTRRRISAHQYWPPKTEGEQEQIVKAFVEACITGDMPKLMSLLAVDCVSQSDGGGKASTAIYPLVGAEKVALFMLGVIKKAPKSAEAQIVRINGVPGIVGYATDKPFVVIAFDILDHKIQHIYHILNPDKLQHIPTIQDRKLPNQEQQS